MSICGARWLVGRAAGAATPGVGPSASAAAGRWDAAARALRAHRMQPCAALKAQPTRSPAHLLAVLGVLVDPLRGEGGVAGAAVGRAQGAGWPVGGSGGAASTRATSLPATCCGCLPCARPQGRPLACSPSCRSRPRCCSHRRRRRQLCLLPAVPSPRHRPTLAALRRSHVPVVGPLGGGAGGRAGGRAGARSGGWRLVVGGGVGPGPHAAPAAARCGHAKQGLTRWKAPKSICGRLWLLNQSCVVTR